MTLQTRHVLYYILTYSGYFILLDSQIHRGTSMHKACIITDFDLLLHMHVLVSVSVT